MKAPKAINPAKGQGYQSCRDIEEEDAALLGSKTIESQQEPESCSVTLTVKRWNWATVAGFTMISLLVFSTLFYFTLLKSTDSTNSSDSLILGTPPAIKPENLKKKLPAYLQNSPRSWVCCANYAIDTSRGWACCLDKDNNEVQAYSELLGMACCQGGDGSVVYASAGTCDHGPYHTDKISPLNQCS